MSNRDETAWAVSIRLAPDDEGALESAIARAQAEEWATRLLDRDTSLWTTDPAVAETIAERLGWLDAPRSFTERIAGLEGFGEKVRDAGFRHAVLAGMGGSSLAPWVLASAFGSDPDWLSLRVLDSTDPAAVAAATDDLDPLAMLFITSTKSGTTAETLAFHADAWERIHAELEASGRHREDPGDWMALITDPGHSLTSIPHHDQIPSVFLNPPDVGGRYSALTYVGLVPASVIGLDLDALLASASEMLAQCREPDPRFNPGVLLGLALGSLARLGRDKLTLVIDPAVEAFGAWAEQLVAESTGKNGTGIVPVDLEPLGRPGAYGPDRVFLRLSLVDAEPPSAADGTSADALLDQLADAGHPVIRLTIQDPIDLAAEFVRWEVATAIAGAVLEIDPFDQPNVEEAKEATRRILAGHDEDVAAQGPVARDGGLALYGDATLREGASTGTVVGELRRHLARLRPDAYLAIGAFIAPTAERDAAVATLRAMLRDATTRATTAGYGPRYLHSTGQLHKGGPPSGWFLQLTADHPVDRPIPGQHHTFGQLIDAQAAGDFEALEAHGLPIMRIHLGADPDAGLASLVQRMSEALADPSAPG
jgi:transaldolase/glucose-6-phosphate isomerase